MKNHSVHQALFLPHYVPPLNSPNHTYITAVDQISAQKTEPIVSTLSRRKCSFSPPSYTQHQISEYRIVLHIIENWGHPSIITASKIDVIGENRLPILVEKITPFFSKYNSDLLPLLITKEFNKGSIEEAWSADWNPGHPVALILSFHSKYPPASIRIWNGSFEPTAGVRKVQLYCGENFLREAEVPKEFGLVIPLIGPKMLHYPTYSPSFHALDDSDFHLQDSYGKFSFKKVKIITIECFEPHGISELNPHVTGLNCVEFYNVKGEQIDHSAFSEIFIGEGVGIANVKDFWGYHQPKFQENYMLFGSRTVGGILRISFVFKIPYQISKIKIFNYDGETYGPEIGMKKIRIYEDGYQIYLGPLKKADHFRLGTEIWFGDAALLEHLGSKKSNSRKCLGELNGVPSAGLIPKL